MKLVLGVAAATSLFSAAPVLAATDCTLDAVKALGVGDLTLSEAAPAAAGAENAPVDLCVVRGATQERIGSDGKPYAISFELRLPNDWNSRFVHQFNGGADGEVVPATGGLLSGDRSQTALARGYAVVSSDAGHSGAAQPEAGLAGGVRFGLDPKARENYGYGAVMTLQPLAVKFVEAFYGKPIEYTYGVGGSNGGRHAMVAAARMPEAFDGLLVGYPGFDLPKAAIQHAWDLQAFNAVNSDVTKSFSREDLNLVADAIVKACDGLDGLEDGIIYATDQCQAAFDVSTLQCGSGSSNQCLSAAQVEALKKIHAGPTNSKGEPLYVNWLWDRGIASNDWRFWKIETGIPPWDNGPLIAVMGAGALAHVFTTPPTVVDGTPAALKQYLLDFNFDTDAPKIFGTDDQFTQSPMEMITPPGADNPSLAEFRDAGGKMLIVHGVSDPVFSIVDTTEWYKKLDANNGGNAEAFAKFYRVPGSPHGLQGPATDDVDMFSALVAWVEDDKAPDALVAGVAAGNAEAEAAGMMGITRKLCPYPQIAKYSGNDPKVAESFTCE